MRDRPTPEELLKGARAVLDRDIAPSLEGGRRFAAILVSRAMAVAGRAIVNGDAPLRAEARRLAALLDQQLTADLEPETLSAALMNLNRLLADRIRKGGFDAGAARQRVFDHLCQVTRDKLAESNPKYFEQGKAA